MGQVPASDGVMVKRAIIDGRTIDLYGAARAYRILAIAVVMGVCFSPFALALGSSGRSPVSSLIVLVGLQIIVGGTIGRGLYVSGRATGRSRVEYISIAIFSAVFGIVPILGLLPAASGSAAIHMLMNKLGLPVGWLGPRSADIAKLRHGVCHQCGYDLVLLAANRCPECNADIAAAKLTATGFMVYIQVNAAEAAVHRQRCRRVATAGLVLSAVQFAVYFLLLEHTALNFGAVFVLPGLVFGIAAGIVSLWVQNFLREHGRVDFLITGCIGMCFPPLGSVLLLECVGRLNAAVARGRDDSADR